MRDGTLRALGPGICASPGRWDEPTETRHRELALATVRTLQADHVLAGHSAAALPGLPLWAVNLRIVQLSLPVGHSASGSRTTQHLSVQRDPRPSAVMQVNGIACIRPARAIVDIARRASMTSAIVTGDAALHRGLCTVPELHAEVELVRGFPGHQRADRAVAMMDARRESALESRRRVSMSEGCTSRFVISTANLGLGPDHGWTSRGHGDGELLGGHRVVEPHDHTVLVRNGTVDVRNGTVAVCQDFTRALTRVLSQSRRLGHPAAPGMPEFDTP